MVNSAKVAKAFTDRAEKDSEMKKYEKKSKFLDSPAQILSSVLILLWLAVFPLWNGGSYTHLTLDKWNGMNLLAAVTVGLTVAILCLRRHERSKGSSSSAVHSVTHLSARSFSLSAEKPPLTAFLPFLFLLLYLVFLCLSCRFGAWHEQTNRDGMPAVLYGVYRHEGLFTTLTCLLIFVCSALSRPRMRPAAFGTSLALIAAAGIACLQYFQLNPLGLYPPGAGILTSYEFQSTLGNIDFLCGYLSLAVSLLLGAWMLERRGGFFLAAALLGAVWMLCTGVAAARIVLLAQAAVLILVALRHARLRVRALAALSGLCFAFFLRSALGLPWLDDCDSLSFVLSSRSLLWLIPTALLLGGSLLCHTHPGKDLSWRILIPLALALILLALLLFVRLNIPQSAGSLWEFQQTLKGRAEDSFGSWRIGVWRHTVHLIREHPVFGLGPGTFYFALRDHLRAEGISLPEAFDHPHNLFLGEAADAGIPAAVCWLCALLCLIVLGLRKGGWAAVLALAVSAFLLQGIFTMPVCVVTPVFWAVAGLCCAHSIG